MKNYILIIAITFFVSGCSISSFNETKKEPKRIKLISGSMEKEIKEKDLDPLSEILLAQYEEWKGVKYRYGGNSKRGIDCSAFIQRTFKEKLNKKMPRTTYYQAKLGKKVSKKEAKVGDLVFFKTGKNSRHVGIYLEDKKFIHVSQKKGVIISTLDNPYFKRHFWKIKRVLED